MLETEMKLLLSKAEYDYLYSAFESDSETILQTNYYYDTNNFDMDKKGTTCRVRKIGNYYCATMKDHKDMSHGLSEEMSTLVYCVANVMDFFGFHLRQQGCLETARTNLKFDCDVLVTIDKNSYLGIEDYELEIEYDEDKYFLASAILKRLSEMLYFDGIVSSTEEFVSRVGKGKSKSSRFFDRKRERKL